MKIAQKYSHLNGEEYLIVHHKKTYDEILNVIASISPKDIILKKSNDKTRTGKLMIDQKHLNKVFNQKFNTKNWKETRYKYYVTTNPKIMQELILLPYEEQKKFLIKNGNADPIASYKQTDFVRDEIAIEVQFGKYAFVAFDLFVKHLLFYSGGVINVGIEILPTKKMQQQMDTGVAYYEGEVYNILRHGRNNPAVPLLILGIEP